jgi:hypothetical protein
VPSERIYCGGTYRGLIENLDYIDDMGFSAVWFPNGIQFQESFSSLTMTADMDIADNPQC